MRPSVRGCVSTVPGEGADRHTKEELLLHAKFMPRVLPLPVASTGANLSD